MVPITIRDLEIGTGMPKVCLPIVGHTQYEIVSQTMTIASLKPDIVEWRVDWYDDVLQSENLIEMLKQVRKLLDRIPLLLTFRRVEEGGVQECTIDEYTRVYETAIQSGLVDLVDYELEVGDDALIPLIKHAKDAGITVVVSNHDFEKTPAKEELIRRMEKMIDIDADIPKIAVMPNSNRDVLELLDVTDTIHQKYPDVPIITMSMEGRGIVSRVCGEIFGSCVTFGCARKASAPGQIEADDLERAIKIIHETLYHKDEFENMQ